MKRPDDETLMAYADGLLDATERAEIAAFLETDPDARATVAMFQQTATMVAGFGDEAFSKPMPDGLIAMIRDGGPARVDSPALDAGNPSSAPSVNAPKTATILQMQPRQRLAWPTSARELGAIAACLAVVAGVTLTWLGQSETGTNDPSSIVAIGPVSSDGLLASVLEQRPSYQPQTLPNGSNPPSAVVAMSTFRDRSERYCREFELTSGADQRPVSVGVACRNDRGLWTVEGVIKTAAPAEGASGTVKPASGIGEQTALDGLLSMLGASPALSKDEEKAILARGWK